MKRTPLAIVAVVVLTAAVAGRQSPGLTPARILNPSPDSWPTFHGDYSGRHYSTLDQINQANVKNLSLAWVSRLNTSLQGATIGGFGPEPAPGAGSCGQDVAAIAKIKSAACMETPRKNVLKTRRFSKNRQDRAHSSLTLLVFSRGSASRSENPVQPEGQG